jgi:predicted MFS family arabinose efflux permease
MVISISMLTLALAAGGRRAGALVSPYALALLAGSALAGVVFVAIERRAAEPMVPLDLMKNRVIVVSSWAGFFAGVAMFGAIAFVPLFAQGAMGATATQAGSLLTPLMLAWVTMSIVGGRLAVNLGFRPTSIAGLVLMATGLEVLSMAGRATAKHWLVLDMLVIGAGLGLTMLTLLLAVQQAVPRSQLGVSTSLNLFVRSIGGGVGVAVCGVALSAGLAVELSKVAQGHNVVGLTPERAAALAENPNALVEPSARAALPPPVLAALEDAFALALKPVFRLGSLSALLGLVAVLWLPGGAAWRRPSHDEPSVARDVIVETAPEQ